MTTRRDFLAFAGSTALLSGAAGAQAPAKVLRIGFLTDGYDFPELARPALEEGLRELGYVEGKTLAWETRFAKGNFERLPALAVELVNLKVDIIVAGGMAAAMAGKNATPIPVVMITAADPVARGLVRSLARPDGNVTGLTTNGAEIWFKRLDILLELAPKSRRVGLLFNPGNPGAVVEVYGAMAEIARRDRHAEMIRFEARTPSEIESAFQRMKQDHVDSLLIATDYLFIQQEKLVADLAIANRLPSVSGVRTYATKGGLATYDGDFTRLYYLAAGYIDKIAKGAKAGDLPVTKQDTFDLWLNQKTAALIGIPIPAGLLLRASQVIQ